MNARLNCKNFWGYDAARLHEKLKSYLLSIYHQEIIVIRKFEVGINIERFYKILVKLSNFIVVGNNLSQNCELFLLYKVSMETTNYLYITK